MKGYLDAEQLINMKREDLQALAKNMGVGAGGKNEEIIARIVAVELDIPQEAQNAEKAEVAPVQQENPSTTEADQQGSDTRQAATTAPEPYKVRVSARFLDKQLNQVKDVGEIYTVSRERATQLLEAGVAEIVE